MIGSSQLVLIEGVNLYNLFITLLLLAAVSLTLFSQVSKRSPTDWAGRCDAGVKVILPNQTVPVEGTTTSKSLEPGDYVTCQVL